MNPPETLRAEALMPNVRMLADEVGARPAEHVEEMRARQDACTVLCDWSHEAIEARPFLTPDTWGYALGSPLVAATRMLMENGVSV